jgi:hypothetical protein
LRRAALLRDQHRCQVPGCNNVTWLDIHHIELRSEGGPPCHETRAAFPRTLLARAGVQAPLRSRFVAYDQPSQTR